MPALRRPYAVLLACLAGLWLAIFPFLLRTMGLRGDFLAFYTGAHFVWWNDLARLYERELFRAAQLGWVGPFDGAFQFVYPPAFITYYLPLTAFAVDAARVLWVVAMAAALGVAARVSRGWHELSGGLVTLCVLAFAGTYAAFVVGQNSPLTLLLMTIVTLWTAFRPRPLHAGLAAGMLLYKPQLLLGLGVAWLAAPRRAGSRRALAAFLSMGGVWLTVSWLLAPRATVQFFALGQGLVAAVAGVRANISVYAALAQWLPQPLSALAAAAVAVFVLGVLVRVWRDGAVDRWRTAMLWLSALLSSPYVASYDLLLLLLPLSLLLPEIPRSRGLQAVVAAVWIGPAISYLVPGSFWSTWSTMALYLSCAWHALTERDGPVVAGERESTPVPGGTTGGA